MMSDNDTLRAIHATDQRTKAQQEYDTAIVRCSAHTAHHYTFLVKSGLPAPLAARLTEMFQSSYLASIFGFGLVISRGDDDE